MITSWILKLGILILVQAQTMGCPPLTASDTSEFSSTDSDCAKAQASFVTAQTLSNIPKAQKMIETLQLLSQAKDFEQMRVWGERTVENMPNLVLMNQVVMLMVQAIVQDVELRGIERDTELLDQAVKTCTADLRWVALDCYLDTMEDPELKKQVFALKSRMASLYVQKELAIAQQLKRYGKTYGALARVELLTQDSAAIGSPNFPLVIQKMADLMLEVASEVCVGDKADWSGPGPMRSRFNVANTKENRRQIANDIFSKATAMQRQFNLRVINKSCRSN